MDQENLNQIFLQGMQSYLMLKLAFVDPHPLHFIIILQNDIFDEFSKSSILLSPLQLSNGEHQLNFYNLVSSSLVCVVGQSWHFLLSGSFNFFKIFFMQSIPDPVFPFKYSKSDNLCFLHGRVEDIKLSRPSLGILVSRISFHGSAIVL